jgi:hypothetical protein
MIAQRYKVKSLPQRMSKLIFIVRDSTLKPMASIGVPPTAGHLSDHYPDIFNHFSQLEKYRHVQTFIHMTSNGTAVFATDGFYREPW